MPPRIYEVFARRERREPLHHVGTVSAASPELARVYARSTYDEEKWVEMIAVPREAIVVVTDLRPLVEEGG